MTSQLTNAIGSTRTIVSPATLTEFDQLAFMNLYRVYHGILSDDEREALGLVVVENTGYGEVAKLMELTCEEVKALVFCARRRLLSGLGRTLAELDRQSVA